ncbi:MAG: glycine zipper family protein [Alphaproteobacteria bacterium]|nr:glycine zipper family protein [Alphaproteobacteria bacterium]
MKIKIFFVILALLPCVSFGATRDGGNRAGIRGPSLSVGPAVKTKNINLVNSKSSSAPVAKVEEPAEVEEVSVTSEEVEEYDIENLSPEECREAYRECMDDFCLLDESEGGRCSCSNNIKQSKKLIKEIQDIELAAEKQYTEGVEREKLGAKAKFIKFGESDQAKKSSRKTGIDLVAWINGDTNSSLDADADIGDNLYDIAAESCDFILKTCDNKRADMEEKLYQREILKDCKTFTGYLAEQKRAAESNKRTADAAVRSATLDMLGTTNKYNRGECLLAYRACIADKGGCGVQFENCLDAKLLERRANACENILDQCMAVRTFVLDDWKDEAKMILADAAVYSDRNMRLTCNAKIRACLEDGCAVSTDTGCLTNVNVAAGVCPIINECDAKIPGLKQSWNEKLVALRTDFCQSDVDKCLRNKCGENFTGPQCLGKNAQEIVDLCPQDMFPSCKSEKFYDVIVSSVLLQMNYQMMQGCINYYDDMLGRICGTDMNCLPKSDIVETLTKLPSTESGKTDLRQRVKDESKTAVEEFFKQFEKEATVDACKSAQQPAGRKSLKDSIFVTAKMIAENGAENRYLTDLESRVAELSRQQDVEEARENCLTLYKPEKKKAEEKDEKTSYSYIKSVSFEPSLRNCHVCRMQRVCEVGGEKKSTSMLKAAAGGLSTGASAGTMVSAGWGTAIGALVGAAAFGAMGYASGGQETFCQEIESCEDVNM